MVNFPLYKSHEGQGLATDAHKRQLRDRPTPPMCVQDLNVHRVRTLKSFFIRKSFAYKITCTFMSSYIVRMQSLVISYL